MLICLHGHSSENGRAVINLAGNRVLMTYFYIPSFSYGMGGDLYYSLVMNSKIMYKVHICLLLAQT